MSSVQARFNPKLFADQMGEMGLTYQWSRAVKCPCQLQGETGNWDPGCAFCGSDGWLYVHPKAGTCDAASGDYQNIKAIFSTASNAPDFAQNMGPYPFGMAQMTVGGEIRIGYRDRFIGVEQVSTHSEILKRLPGDLAPIGKYGRPRSELEGAMRYEPIRINHVTAKAGDQLVTYFEGLDYQYTPGYSTGLSLFKWYANRGPAVGESYAIHYDYHPVWVVDDAVYAIQNSKGPTSGLVGPTDTQLLPTTFKVALDFLTQRRD